MSILVGRDRRTMIGNLEEVESEIERVVIVGGREVEVSRDPTKEAEVRIENLIGDIEVLTSASTKITSENVAAPLNPLPHLHPPLANHLQNPPEERSSKRRLSKPSKTYSKP